MTVSRFSRAAGLLLALSLVAFLGLHTGEAHAAGLGDFLRVNMAPVMFAALVVFLLLGYPVAFALAANGLLFAIVGIELGLFQENFLQAMPERIYGTMNNDVLLAIPFFTFMGLILERSGMAEDLLDTIGQLFGPVRGGLAYAVIFVGALLAATTGVVAASVISMGLISLPIMLRYGYDRRLATGVIAASGTLAQIIPPSLVLIVLADQLGRSVGDMYEGAFIPGLVLSAMYAGYVFLVTMIYPSRAPGLPPEAQTLRDADGETRRRSLLVITIIAFGAAYAIMKIFTKVQAGADFVILTMSIAVGIAFVIAIVNKLLGLNLLSRMTEQVIFVMVPPLALIFLVLGTIFIGVATPTEGGAMGATGAILLAYGKKRMTFDLLKQAVESTAKLSAFVLFILVGARVFSLTFYGVNGHLWVEHLLVGLPGGATGFLIVVNIMVFLLAFFPARAGRREARHRPDLVRRDPGREHADLVHAPALRFRAVLPALGRTEGPLPRQGHGQHDGAGDHGADLLGRRALRGDPVHHGGLGRVVPADGDALQGIGGSARPEGDRQAVRLDPDPGLGGAGGPARPGSQRAAFVQVTRQA